MSSTWHTNHRARWEGLPDGEPARVINRELSWNVSVPFGILTYQHLCDEAGRRYWSARADASQRIETVA